MVATMTDDVNWADRRYLDGPGFAEWLAERLAGGDLEALRVELGESTIRRFYDWQQGAPVYFDTADKVLTRLGINLDAEVPEELWISHNRTPGRPRISTETRHQAELMIVAGRGPTDIARELGVSEASVRRWRSELR